MSSRSTVAAATEASIKAATHLTDVDRGAVQALRYLAEKIDTEDELRDLALQWAADNGEKPPAIDNVTLPTYLKFCESLGLTPAGRARLGAKKTEAPRGKLGQLRAVAQASGA